MSYVDKNLIPNETVVFRGKLHWSVFLVPIALVAAGIMIGFMPHESFKALSLMSAALIVVGVCQSVAQFVKFKSSEFSVTDKRVIIKTGLLRRTTLELFNHKVEGLGVDQDLSGRMLGYGTLVISGTGGSKSAFKKLGSAMEFRKAFYAQVEAQGQKERAPASA